ncbi:unnamed protein product [Closterium sp. Naga37s-1]|nr:unnamed protein product [Closterium sp. Naga37s-1]
MSRSRGMASPGGYSSGNPSGNNSPSVHSGVKRLSPEDRQRLANMLRALQIQQQAHAEAQPPASAEASAGASRPAEGGAERPAEAGAERGADMAVDAPACAQGGERERQGRDMAGANGEAGGTWGDSPSSPSSPPPGGAMRCGSRGDEGGDEGENERGDEGGDERGGERGGKRGEARCEGFWRLWREMAHLYFDLRPLLPPRFDGNNSHKDILEIVRRHSDILEIERKHSGALVRPAASRDGAGAEAAQTVLMMDCRKDILEIVRKHSGALVRPAASRDGAGAEAAQTALTMDRQYWREMADLFFVLHPSIHMLSLLPAPLPHGHTSRKDILEIVRKHSGALVRPAASRDGAGAEAAQTALMMDRQYWREMADLFFVRGVQLRGDATQDGSFRDVVFFVRDEPLEWRGRLEARWLEGEVRCSRGGSDVPLWRGVVASMVSLPLAHPSHSHVPFSPTHPPDSPIPPTHPSHPLNLPPHSPIPPTQPSPQFTHPSHSPIPPTYPSSLPCSRLQQHPARQMVGEMTWGARQAGARAWRQWRDEGHTSPGADRAA